MSQADLKPGQVYENFGARGPSRLYMLLDVGDNGRTWMILNLETGRVSDSGPSLISDMYSLTWSRVL